MKKDRNRAGDDHALLWVIYGCSALALATPLLVSHSASLPVTFVQTLAFQGLVELAFAAWLALAVLDRRYRPKMCFVLLALAAFTTVALLSLLFVPDPSMSFWSRIWRMSGVWWSLHMFAWFLTLHSTLRGRENWRQLLGISCVIAGVAFTIAFTRWLRLPDTVTMGGTLGNPSHMAAYLLPHVFIAVYLAIGNSGLLRKSLLAAAIAFAVGVIMTGSRGGAVALALGSLMSFLLLIAASGVRKRAKAAIVAATAFLAVGAVAGVLMLRTPSMKEWGSVHLPSFAQRLVYRNFGGDRWFLWEYALKGAAERPIFGWGNEGFAYLYDHHYDHETRAKDFFFERWQDRAHNRYLDILVAYGAVGLAAYLFLWGAVIVAVVKRHILAEESGTRTRGLLLLASLLTIAAYDLFMLETLAQAAVVFLIFGLAASVKAEGAEGREGAGRGAWRRPVAASVIFAGIVLFICATFMPYIRAKQFDEAMGKIASDPGRAAEIFGIMSRWPNPYRNEMVYAGAFSMLMLEADLPSAKAESLVRLLASEARRAADGAPLSTRETLMAAQMSRLLAYYDPAAMADARIYAERLRDMAPGKFDGYFEIARVDLSEGDAEAALRNLELAAERVYVPRREFALMVEVNKAAAYAARGDHQAMFDSLAAASAGGYKLGDDPLPVIMMAGSSRPGDELPISLVNYARDIAGLRSGSLRTGLAAARILAIAGRGEEASELLDKLILKRPDGADDIAAMREEMMMIEGYVEEETE